MKNNLYMLILLLFASFIFSPDFSAQDKSSFKSKIEKYKNENGERKVEISPEVIAKNLSNKLKNNINSSGRYRQNSTSFSSNTVSFKPAKIDKSKFEAPVEYEADIPDSKIIKNEENNTILFISMKPRTELSKLLSVPVETKAAEFFEHYKDIFKVKSPSEELKLSEKTIDNTGQIHLTYDEYYDGIPIWNKNIIVHFDENEEIYSVNGRYEQTMADLRLKPELITSSAAIEMAVSNLSSITKLNDFNDVLKSLLDYKGPEVKKYIFKNDEDFSFSIVWQVKIVPNIVDNWYYFIDANTGEIIEKYNNTRSDGPVTAQAVDLMGSNRSIGVYQYQSTYYMINASKPMWVANQNDITGDPRGAIVVVDARNVDYEQATMYHVTSTNNIWSDPASVSANYAMDQVFNYYSGIHQRNSFDNEGATMLSLIHVTSEGRSWANAFWNGKFTVYGDGGDIFHPLVKGFDVIAHEFTHAVVGNTVSLEYKFESGALDEAFADWGAAMIDREDWLIGEDITKPPYYGPGVPMRNMIDPHNGGTNGDHLWLPSHMNEFQNMSINEDNGGVHVNVGIINRATYLIGDAIGKDKLEKIYFRILGSKYLSRQAKFVDMRIAAIQAATDIYGAQSTEAQAVRNAFEQVGILGDDPTPPNPQVPAVQGDEWITFVYYNQMNNSLWRARPVVANNDTDILRITSTAINYNSGSAITVSDDGSLIIFVDINNNMQAINVDGSNQRVIESSGVWSSISLSPDGNYLAATTIYDEPIIYIFDLVNGTSRQVEVYIPTTSHTEYEGKPKFVDAMDWNLSSTALIYDSYNEKSLNTGGTYFFWNINILDVQSGTIYNVFPPQEAGINIGNPVFSNTNEYIFSFDYLWENYDNTGKAADFIVNFNLFTGEYNSIVGYYTDSPMFPSFSSNDDQIVFQYYNSSFFFNELYKVAISQDMLSATADATEYLNPGIYPKWFSIGSRPTDVDEHISNPSEYLTLSNYPNPFNSTTNIIYTIPYSGEVRIRIYDINGRELGAVMDAYKQKGNYEFRWYGKNNNGMSLSSGVYFYELELRGDKGESLRKTNKMILLN